MAEPGTFWPEHIEEPSWRWWRWVTAGMMLLTLAFISHTDSRWARAVMRVTAHWLTQPMNLPRGWPALWTHLADRVLPASAQPVGRGDTTTWLAPVADAKVAEAFGWHGRGVRATFVPEVRLIVSSGSPVIAGTTGRVVAVGRHWVEFRAATYVVVVAPIKPLVKAGSLLAPTTEIGVIHGRSLTLRATVHDLPVNPLGSTLYGRQWLNP
ncbi:MAG: hypothetical protein OWU33_16120 [Firmicutes bacterium]|nr:hypothetical protein [Bacillota bacterium]